MTGLLLLIVKASALLALVLCLVRVLRRGSAGTRHTIWSVAFAALLALPALALLLPALDIPVPASLIARPSAPVAASLPAAADVNNVMTERIPEQRSIVLAASPGTESSPPQRPLSLFASLTLPQILWWTWGTGTVAAIAALLLSLTRVRELARTSQDLTDPGWREATDAAARRAGLRAPVRLVVSDQVRTPMAGGLFRPTVFLPAGAPSWDEERRNVVLAHELAHLGRRDPLRHVAARLAVACYWFHPLAWLAAREASIAREEACDEAVLALGTRPSSYAQVLLDFADLAQPPARSLAALPIVERSLLEKRVMAILADRAHRSTPPRPLIPAALIALLVLGLAAARPAARTRLAAVTPPPAVTAPAAAATTPAAPVPGVAAVSPAPAQRDTASSEGCATLSGSFRGRTSNSDVGGRTVIHEQIGTSGGDRIIFKTIGDLDLCLVTTGVSDESLQPSDWPGRGSRTTVQTRRGGVVHRLETTRASNGAQRVVWRVNGSDRAFDAAAQEWRERVLTVADTIWELSNVLGEESAMRGQISAVRGEESALRGEISALRGQVSAMRGEISAVQGEESALRGEISAIQGHVSALQGAISAERGSISALNGTRYGLSERDRQSIANEIRKHEEAIARIEREIRDYKEQEKIAEVEKQIRALNANAKEAAIEAEIRKFDVEAKIAGVEKRIVDLNVLSKTGDLEHAIAGLDATGRSRKLEAQISDEIKRLLESIARIR